MSERGFSAFMDCRRNDKMIEKMLARKNQQAQRKAEEERKGGPKQIVITISGTPIMVEESFGAPPKQLDRYDVRMLLPQLREKRPDGRSRLDPVLNFERYRALVLSHGQDAVQQTREKVLRQTGMTPTQEALLGPTDPKGVAVAATATAAAAALPDDNKMQRVAQQYGIVDWARQLAGVPDYRDDDEDDDDRRGVREFPSYGDDGDEGDSGEDKLRSALRARQAAAAAAEQEDKKQSPQPARPESAGPTSLSPDEEQPLGPRERLARMLEQQLNRTTQRLGDDAKRLSGTGDFDVQSAVRESSKRARDLDHDEKKRKKLEKKEKKKLKKEKKKQATKLTFKVPA